MEEVSNGMPRARTDQLLCRNLPDGLMLYDPTRHHAYTLNRTAALVWQQCDGRTGVAAMAAQLQQTLNAPAGEEVVWLALDRLEKAQLLQGPLSRPAGTGRYTRREAVRELGLAGAVGALLPVVASLAAPPAARAVSVFSEASRAEASLNQSLNSSPTTCKDKGETCISDSECCSEKCRNGKCRGN
jgi:hypothetical protein